MINYATKMKKSLLTTLAIFATTILAIGQSRNAPTIANIIEKSEKLTQATGWCQNSSTQEWVSNPNCLYESECKSYWIDHTENFLWIQIWKLELDGQTYIALVSEVLGGHYKYPNIKEDWQSEKITKWLIVTEDEYSKFKTDLTALSGQEIVLQSKKNDKLSNYYNILGGDKSYTEENILKLITASIRKDNYSSEGYKFNSQTVDGLDVVRFRLQKYYYQSSYSTSNDLEKQYFEMNLSDFLKILI